jgi:hypothetical protein
MKINRQKAPLHLVVSIEIVVLMTAAAFFLPGGEDLHRFYLPFAQGCLDCGLNPWHASLILFPLRFIPPILLWPVMVLLTGVGLLWACHRLETNPAFVLLAFPTMGLVWLGQVDVLVIVGLVLALRSPNPYLRGVGLVLASIKPHVAGVAILVLLWADEQRWKTLLVPAAVFLLTVVLWGIDWPLRWLEARPEDMGLPVWGKATLLFPFSLVTFLSILLVEGKRKRVLAALLASALGVPWFGVYSYVVFLVFIAPWWAVPISYLWAAAYPWLGNRSMRFAWILPLTLLVYVLWPAIKERRARGRSDATQNAQSPPTTGE